MTKHTRTQHDQWQAQRDERMSTLLQQLEVGVQAIQTSEDFQRYLRTAANFHQYSPNNVLLILAQKPDATRVAGYTTWQALGRQVKKGEKAIYIFAPQPYFVTTADEAGEEKTREGLTFRSVLPSPVHSGAYSATGRVSPSRPSSTSSIAAVAVTGLLIEARGKIVASASAGASGSGARRPNASWRTMMRPARRGRPARA